MDDLPGGVITLTSDMRIRAANRTMGALVGRSPDELIGEPIDIVLTAPSRILFQTHVYPALKAQGRVEEVFLTLATATGEPTPVLFNAVLAADSADVRYDALIVRILARARWETDLLAATRAIEQERAASQQLAEELASAAQELEARHAEEERNREFRDAFMGVISHELRTPITTIYGMSHLLRQRHASMASDVLDERLADIELESDRLRRLTEDLLILSRAEGRGLVIAKDPVAIGHVVRAAVEGERIRATGHQYVVDISPDVPLVLGEDVYVEQVIRNFLSNAAKYSPSDTTVHVATTNEEGGVGVRVIDEGPGFGDLSPDRLFELFYRAPETIGHTGGAGIGLFVCRELIHAMGGRIWAAPAPSGAEFGFWLPAAEDVVEE